MNINYKSNYENQMHSDNSPCSPTCETKIENCAKVAVQAESITEQCDVTPKVIMHGPVVVKVPVVLAETNITIPVEAIITLDQIATEIKRIKKNVFLTQSRLIPFSQDGYPHTGILFIEGFIRKNIEYATESCHSCKGGNSCGDIRHCTVEVPFNFTTRVTFLRKPIFTENNAASELEFFTDELRGCDVCADPILGRNACDQSFFFTEYFNEKPFVELVKADITEIDIHTNPKSSCHEATEQKFSQITEKIVVNLTLKVLQNQQIKIESLGPICG